MGSLSMSHVTISASLLLLMVVTSSTLPVQQVKRQVEDEDPARTFTEGLLILREIVVANYTIDLQKYLQINGCDELVKFSDSECWRNEMQAFCNLWKLRTLSHETAKVVGEDKSLNFVEWAKTELAHVSNDDEAKVYILEQVNSI